MSEVEEKPIPSGEILVFQQYIEDGYFKVRCERCAGEDAVLTPFDMGKHALKVHLRSSFHVKMKVEQSEPVVPEVSYGCCWGDPEMGHSTFCIHRAAP